MIPCSNVIIYLLRHFSFVSDVTVSDFEEMLDYFEKQEDDNITTLLRLWREYFRTNKWKVVSNAFWNRFEPFWELPDDLKDGFLESDLVVFKGF